MITVAIPTYNSMATVTKSLNSVLGRIAISVDNGSSDDSGRIHFCRAVVNRFPGNSKRKNIAIVRAVLAALCETEFILYLDSDVILNESIDILKANLKDDIGMVGYCMDNNTHHLQMGNALMRTEIARKINWSLYPDMCNCLNVKVQLEALGLKTLQLPSDKVIHLRGKQ